MLQLRRLHYSTRAAAAVQLFDCCCHARAGTSSCFASCRITKNMTFTGVGKQESVGSHLVVKNAKISSKIHISLSICSQGWRKRTKSDQRLRTYEKKCQWSTVKDNIIPASGRPQKHTGEHVSRRKRTAEAVSSMDTIASAQSRWGRDNKPTYTPQLLRMRKI